MWPTHPNILILVSSVVFGAFYKLSTWTPSQQIWFQRLRNTEFPFFYAGDMNGPPCSCSDYNDDFIGMKYWKLRGGNGMRPFRRVRKIPKKGYYVRRACLSSRLSVRIEQLASHCTDFYEIWYWRIFRKSVEKNSRLIKNREKKRILCTKIRGYLWWHAGKFFLELEIFESIIIIIIIIIIISIIYWNWVFTRWR